MKYFKLGLILSILVISLACSDKLLNNQSSKPRVEFSDCTACLDCINLFNCPEDAIKIDTLRGKTYIDTDDCVSCYKCIDDFDCPDNAIVEVVDQTAPAIIEEFLIGFYENNMLKIYFKASGDDGDEGNSYGYRLKIINTSEEEKVYTKFFNADYGDLLDWTISEVTGDSLFLELSAFDEAENYSEKIFNNAVLGEINDFIPPESITDLTAQSQEDKILLTWTSPSDSRNNNRVVSYEIKYSEESLNENNWGEATIYENDISPAQAGIQESLEIVNLASENIFYFAIKSVDAQENISELSNIVSAKIIEDVIAPNPIADLEIIAENVNSISCSWTAPGDSGNDGTASGYVIKIAPEIINETNWNQLEEYPNNIEPQMAGNQEVFIIEDLESTTEYYIGIKAYDDNGNTSALSNVVIGQTQALPDEIAPAQITDLVANSTPTEIKLNWSAVGDDENEGLASYYEIKYAFEEINEENWGSANPIDNDLIPQAPGNQEELIFTDFAYDQIYYFAVKAFDETGNYSIISNSANAMVPSEDDEIAPSAIENLAVIQQFAQNLSTIKVSFTASGDDGNTGTATTYQVKYSNQPITEINWNSATTFENDVEPSASGEQETVSITGLEAGELIYFGIKVIDDNGNISDISNSPGGKIVYQIDEDACHDCGNCIYECPEDAINDYPGYKSIDPDQCVACGDCSCPFGYINLFVIAYND